MSRPVLIKKASGELAAFDAGKLRESLRRSGAADEVIDAIVAQVENELVEGMTTKTIYRRAYKMLKKGHKPAAAKYKLKRAIMELGPSGYAFERFIGEVLRVQGYRTQVSVLMQGRCVTHEVDVVAEEDGHLFLVECKYHNNTGTKTDVKVPLYIQSRFKDVEERWRDDPKNQHKTLKGWVATNTQFTVDAIAYGECIGLNLLSWDYPKGNGLKDLIDRLALFPLTCLATLTNYEKKQLLEEEVVLSRELVADDRLLKRVVKDPNRANRVLKEINDLCAGVE